MILKNKSLGFKIGLLFALIHLGYFILLFIETINQMPHEQAGMGLFMTFIFIDIFLCPLFLLLSSILSLFIDNDHTLMFVEFIINFGIVGSIAWFLIPTWISWIYRKFKRRNLKVQS